MAKKTNKEKKEKFKDNPVTPNERWDWTREMVEDLLKEVMDLKKRLDKLEVT